MVASDDSVEELLDALPDGVVVAGGDGVVTHVNAAGRELLGDLARPGRPLRTVLSLQDLDGCDWFDVLKPYAGLSTRRILVENSWFLSDGTELLVTGRIQRRAPGSPVEKVSVSLRSARARARLERERSELVSTMAHELRSPLTGVRGFTETLLERWEEFADAEKRLIMESIHQDTDRLTRLIADLLEVARIDTGRTPMFAQPVDPVEVVQSVVRSVAAGTGRDIEMVATATTKIMADRDRFIQVITNIVENAVQHGSGQVRVTVSPSKRHGPAHVEVWVEDEGAGIREELRRRIFTKHWKHGASAGSGLGMYIANGLAKAQGGAIEVADSAGGGARIVVLWPTAPGFD